MEESGSDGMVEDIIVIVKEAKEELGAGMEKRRLHWNYIEGMRCEDVTMSLSTPF